MKRPTPEEQRQLVRKWKETGEILEEMRQEKLRGMPYNWEDVVALLELGDHCPPRPENGLGMVEMQRRFRALRELGKE
mgnify:CR=1 FL=1